VVQNASAAVDYAQVTGDRMAEPLERGTHGLDDVCAFLDRLELHAAEPEGPCWSGS